MCLLLLKDCNSPNVLPHIHDGAIDEIITGKLITQEGSTVTNHEDIIFFCQIWSQNHTDLWRQDIEEEACFYQIAKDLDQHLENFHLKRHLLSQQLDLVQRSLHNFTECTLFSSNCWYTFCPYKLIFCCCFFVLMFLCEIFMARAPLTLRNWEAG